MEKELMEYYSLCAALRNLHNKFLKRKQELRLLLEETAAKKSDALLILAKANRLTRHLTGRQRQMAGLSYHLCELKNRIHRVKMVLPKEEGIDEWGVLPVIREDYSNLRELKQAGILILALIDKLKKKILQLDLLELRCRELILSTNKALEVFRYEARIIRRKLYPFGILSLFFRFLRSFLGRTYFTLRDLDNIAALGNITGLVLKIADSPVI
jgi:hypothetical protein